MFNLEKNALKKRTKEELISYIMEGAHSEYVTTASVALKSIRDVNIDYNQENFILVCLSSSNSILKSKVLFKGGISNATVDLKVLFNEVLKTDTCTKILVAHNHPSGNLKPSIADREVTSSLQDVCKLLNISILDHIIFSRKEYFSMREEGMFYED
ncbi:MAG: JAB domain-containing protein [Fusobacteriaceae bacterium]